MATLTNAVRAILGFNLSRPGNLDHPPEFLGYISFVVPIFFFAMSRNYSAFPGKISKCPDSRNNFGFVP